MSFDGLARAFYFSWGSTFRDVQHASLHTPTSSNVPASTPTVMSDFSSFSSIFGIWYQRRRKLEGSTSFSMPCVLRCCAYCLDLMRVAIRLWVWESLKTLFYEIMLLCDLICFGYGHVFMVTILACHILSLDCFIFIWSAVGTWLLPDRYSQDDSATLWGWQCHPVLISQGLVRLNWYNLYMHHVYSYDTLFSTPQ